MSRRTSLSVNRHVATATFVQLVVRVCYGSFNSKSTSLFKKKYREHNERVQAVIPKERLLIYNVKQGWKPLCKFLECDVPEEAFPRENVALSTTHQAISAELEKVKRKLFIVLAICALLACLFYLVFFHRSDSDF